MKLKNHQIPLSLIIVTALLFIGTTGLAQIVTQDVANIQKSTIQAVVRNLKTKHVRLKAIDDHFSKQVWKKYIEGLDPEKNIFLMSDLEALKKYEVAIDDELNAGTLDFFNATFKLYQQRLTESEAGFKKLLSQPMQFAKDESIQLDGRLRQFAADKSALREVWRKRAKYWVLNKMFELDQRKINSPSLEKEARIKVEKWLTDRFKLLKAEYALNEKFAQYVNTITLEVDPHTVYAAPIEARRMEAQMARKFFGIGIELEDKDGSVNVKSIRPGGSASKSGQIGINDRILRISDAKGEMMDVSGIPVREIRDLIRGDKDSEIVLDLMKSNGLRKTVSLKREEMKDEEGRARSAVMEENGQKIGYIYLPQFYTDTKNAAGLHASNDVELELKKLNKAGVSAVIVDLRNNGGGALKEVVRMSGFFLGKGPKAQLKGLKGVEVQNSFEPAMFDGPMAVMINEYSASASEIFAAVIQDYKRGVIIGSPTTYGKGTAQSTLPMGKLGDSEKGIPDQNFGSIALSEYQFYRVNGGSTQLRGVKADVVLPGVLGYLKIKEKDNMTALAWDSIPAAVYTEKNEVINWNNTLNLARKVGGADNAFKTIEEASRQLALYQTVPVSLNRTKFIKMQEAQMAYHRKIKAVEKLPSNQMIKIFPTSGERDEPGKEWYMQWLKMLSTDLYISQSFRIMNRLIAPSATANMNQIP